MSRWRAIWALVRGVDLVPEIKPHVGYQLGYQQGYWSGVDAGRKAVVLELEISLAARARSLEDLDDETLALAKVRLFH